MNPSPLHDHFDSLDASFIDYGERVRMLAQLAAVEIEYAPFRRSAALVDCPHRGLLRLTGKDRLDFLHRMFTGDCRSMKVGDVRRMFLLTVKGRIMADLLVIHREDATLLDLDVHDAAAVAAELDKLLFGEDVQIENLTQARHRLSLHGPRAADVADRWLTLHAPPESPAAVDPQVIWTYRRDETGEVGVHLWLTAEQARTWIADLEPFAAEFRLRPAGWLAFNIARIEAGLPLFHVDFGPDSLPHETGPLLNSAVSFTKGCYRGQEIVARMQSLGHPAKLLIAFRGTGDTATSLPIAGVPLYDAADPAAAQVVGAVTSSTLAPMLSQTAIGFAMVKWAHRAIGTTLHVPAEGRTVPIVVADPVAYRREENT